MLSIKFILPWYNPLPFFFSKKTLPLYFFWPYLQLYFASNSISLSRSFVTAKKAGKTCCLAGKQFKIAKRPHFKDTLINKAEEVSSFIREVIVKIQVPVYYCKMINYHQDIPNEIFTQNLWCPMICLITLARTKVLNILQSR